MLWSRAFQSNTEGASSHFEGNGSVNRRCHSGFLNRSLECHIDSFKKKIPPGGLSLWRKLLARSAINRKDDGSNPSRYAFRYDLPSDILSSHTKTFGFIAFGC